MGQVLHGCARTTEAVRRAIQHSQASLNALAAQYGINPKTVAKWRQRQNVQDSQGHDDRLLCRGQRSAEFVRAV